MKYITAQQWIGDRQPWSCPWCGEVSEATVGVPESQRDLRAWDAWLEAHVVECEPWLIENGVDMTMTDEDGTRKVAEFKVVGDV